MVLNEQSGRIYLAHDRVKWGACCEYGKLQMLFEEVLEWQVLKEAMNFQRFIDAHLQIAKF